MYVENAATGAELSVRPRSPFGQAEQSEAAAGLGRQVTTARSATHRQTVVDIVSFRTTEPSLSRQTWVEWDISAGRTAPSVTPMSVAERRGI